jgi:hypothetical protein
MNFKYVQNVLPSAPMTPHRMKRRVSSSAAELDGVQMSSLLLHAVREVALVLAFLPFLAACRLAPGVIDVVVLAL